MKFGIAASGGSSPSGTPLPPTDTTPSTPTTPPATPTSPSTGSGVAVSVSQLGFGGSAGTRSVTYTNNTGARITFIKATISSGKFQQSNDCGEVAAGASCTANVTYYPSNSGSTTATFTMTSTAPNSPHVVTLSASGSTLAAAAPSAPATSTPSTAGGVTASASALAFDSSNRTRTVTFRNDTGSKVTFIQASISSGKFQQSNNCGEVAAGSSCTATVTYYPGNGGSSTATFTMTSTASNSPTRVTLSATPGKKLVTI
jgi:P pilus assembly chaperone PapD